MRRIDSHTEVEIVFRGLGKAPQSFHVSTVVGQELRRLLKQKLAEASEDPVIPADAVLPELAIPEKRAAACLRGARYRDNISQRTLAKTLGIRPHHLSEMEHGKRPIGKEMAKKLAKVFNCDYRVFL